MPSVYCLGCGNPTQFSLVKPRVCCYCAKPFNETIEPLNTTLSSKGGVNTEFPSRRPPPPPAQRPAQSSISNRIKEHRKRKVISRDDYSDNLDETPPEEFDPHDDPANDLDYVPEIDHLDVDIDVSRSRMTIKDLARNKPRVDKPQDKPVKINKKQIIAEFQREAGLKGKGTQHQETRKVKKA